MRKKGEGSGEAGAYTRNWRQASFGCAGSRENRAKTEKKIRGLKIGYCFLIVNVVREICQNHLKKSAEGTLSRSWDFLGTSLS